MPMDLCMPKRLKTAREYLKLSQEYVAKQMNIHRTSLVAIEAGKRKVTSDELKSFSEIYGWTVDELVYGWKIDDNNVLTLTLNFKELTEQDQQEILNLIEFKRMMNVKKKTKQHECLLKRNFGDED